MGWPNHYRMTKRNLYCISFILIVSLIIIQPLTGEGMENSIIDEAAAEALKKEILEKVWDFDKGEAVGCYKDSLFLKPSMIPLALLHT